MLLADAELELGNIKAGWEVAKTNALERGVKIGPSPFGCFRGDDGRIVPHETFGPVLTEAFRIAAAQGLVATVAYLRETAPE